MDRFVGTYIWHIHIWHIYIRGENTSRRPIPSRAANLPPSLLIKRKGNGRPTGRAGKAKGLALGSVEGYLVYSEEEAGMA